MKKLTRSTLVRFLPVTLVALAVSLSLLVMFGSNGATMEEGSLLIGAELVLKGQIPNADFEHLYGPGDLWTLAGAFAMFGVSITVERLVGLAYRALLLWGLYRIGKSVSPAVAAGSALLGWVLIIPFGLIAYSWIAAISFAVAALSIAIDAGTSKRQWFISGILAGLALLYRADLILVIAVGFGWLIWQSRKEHRIAFMKDGIIEQLDTPAKIVLNPATEYVKKFTEEVPREKVLIIEDVMDAPTTENLSDLKVSKNEIIENERLLLLACFQALGYCVGPFSDNHLRESKL